MAALYDSSADKDQFVTSLAALVCADSSVDVTADNINAVISASGNNVAAYWGNLYASYIEKVGGVKNLYPKAGGAVAAAPGGAAAAAPAGGAPAAKPAEAKPVVEEVDALEGGMDMFGGGGGGDY